MEEVIKFITNFTPYILIGLVVIIIILFVITIVLFKSLNKLEVKYRKLMRGVNNKNLEELIVSYLDNVEEAKKISEDIKTLYQDMDTRIKGCVQNVAVTRYKAFEDVGSDLSYSIALLDNNNNGIILTGIFGRNESTTYAKPIDKGISRYDLSEEEQQVLNDAMVKSQQ